MSRSVTHSCTEEPRDKLGFLRVLVGVESGPFVPGLARSALVWVRTVLVEVWSLDAKRGALPGFYAESGFPCAGSSGCGGRQREWQ